MRALTARLAFRHPHPWRLPREFAIGIHAKASPNSITGHFQFAEFHPVRQNRQVLISDIIDFPKLMRLGLVILPVLLASCEKAVETSSPDEVNEEGFTELEMQSFRDQVSALQARYERFEDPPSKEATDALTADLIDGQEAVAEAKITLKLLLDQQAKEAAEIENKAATIDQARLTPTE